MLCALLWMRALGRERGGKREMLRWCAVVKVRRHMHMRGYVGVRLCGCIHGRHSTSNAVRDAHFVA